MNRISSITLFCLLQLSCYRLETTFPPSEDDYDAYGLKLAINERLLVQTQNAKSLPIFLIQWSPYNLSSSTSRCSISNLNQTDHYIYTVAVGKQGGEFFLAGELINNRTGTFIGVAKYNATALTCATRFAFTIQYFTQYQHSEHYILGVEPTGRLAYGFSNEFLLLLVSQNTSVQRSWNGSLTWWDPSFLPLAVDISDRFGVIAGFVQSVRDSVLNYIPIIYLLNFNTTNTPPLVIVDEYRPNATQGTWQDLLTNADANYYSAKYDMSLSISNDGNVLVGMQFINRAFLFSVDRTNPTKLNYLSRFTNGRSLGYGKGVAWLDNGIAAVLVNIYSLNYHWASSEVHFYDIRSNGYNSNSTPLSVFPNNNQILPTRMSLIFLNIVSSPSSLALMDSQGNVLIFSPTSAGFYPWIEDKGTTPFFTSPRSCLPGTFKNQTGIHGCLLCLTGTKNPGNATRQCLPCSSASFCPLGSVADVSPLALGTTVQVKAYPKSPESTIFDEVLIQNMFQIRGGRCLPISPLFWTLIVGGIGIVIITVMMMLKVFIGHPRSHALRQRLKYFFRHTDLINEGELWVGGIASFCVIVLVSFAYAFSNNYYKQYPIETTSDSHFACEESLRNAKFQTSTQSLAIPFADAEKEMATLLKEQAFQLNVEFINTLIYCDAVSLQALYGTKWSPIRWSNCSNDSSILTLSIPLPYQHLSVQVLLADVKTIGALRLSLQGDEEHTTVHYHLKQLNFKQSFFKDGQTLAPNVTIHLDMTKVINETMPIEGEESDFTGIYIPTFSVDVNSLFLSNDQYVRSTAPLTTLTVVLAETPYYVKNLQQPIAKRSEIIFHNLLFTVVCLEIFGLIFLLYKLVLKPLQRFLISGYAAKHHKGASSKHGDWRQTEITPATQLTSTF